NQLTRMVGDIKPGENAKFTVIRDGAVKEVQVRIEIRTDTVASDNNKLWPGLHIFPLTDEIRKSLELDDNASGLYVMQVIGKSPADIVGLRQGDLIKAVNGENVADIAAFYKTLREKAAQELWFSFSRNGSTLESLKFKR
ncbi:MAG: PDZ domain-containing protein, partial [Treponema sp.]|nr:PDZ domain-containing protein [Treponema sp.]